MTSSFSTTHSRATTAATMTSRRQAQAAALRTRGATAASSRFADIRQAYLPVAGCRAEGVSGPGIRASTIRSRRRHSRSCAAISRHLRGYPKARVARRPGPQPATPAREPTPRGKYWWVRWVVLGIVAIVLAVEVALGWDQLAKAWTSLYQANWWWLIAAVLAAAASMHSFAQIQRTLLRSAGVHVKQLRSEAAFYAANSLSTTLPGGPVLSATFLFRQQRIWGASTVVASWQLVMSGVLQAVGIGTARVGRRVPAGREEQPVLVAVHAGRVRRAVAAGPGGGVAAGADRGHRQPGFVVGQFGSRQAGRHRPGEVARDAHAAGIGQPGPARPGGGVQLVDCSTGSPTWPAWASPPTPPATTRRSPG